MPFVYEEGAQVATGSHGSHDDTYVEGSPLTDNGKSSLVFEEGNGLGGNSLVEDFEDQDWTDNFTTTTNDWSITTEAYEGSYAADGNPGQGSSTRLVSILDIPTFGLLFRYRVKVKNTSINSEDGDFHFGYQDNDSYYQLDVKPRNTDNPQFGVRRVDNGSTTTEITAVSPDFDREEWLTVRGEVQSDGTAAFECDHDGGTQRLTGSLSDTSKFTSGKVGPRAYVRAVFDLIEVNDAKSGSLPTVV